MGTKKLGQEPIVPTLFRRVGKYDYRTATEKDLKDSCATLLHTEGMSKRFYAACCAIDSASRIIDNMTINSGSEIIGIDSKEWDGHIHYPIAVVKIAYKLADELLKQENE